MNAILQSRPKRKYPCRQSELFTIVQLGWTSYLQYLTAFSDFNDHYDAALATARLADLANVRVMPDIYVRSAEHKILRIQLLPLSNNCLILWMDMSSYIRDAFPTDEYVDKRLAAGHAYYPGALNHDWEQVSDLMSNGLQFLTDNTPQLTAGGMPATFPDAFTGARNAFMTGYAEYAQALEESRILTDQRITASNILFSDLRAMFADAKRIFRQDAALRLQFNFKQIHGMISGYRYAHRRGPTTPPPDPE
ncbi:MAG: hypothetical protein K9J06_09905 [Flavobacteriales bacterium]|nr:hypothetical protein [Flavobacteriales bacterium]